MIAHLISKLRVNVNDIVVEQAGKQTVAQENVIQVLRVAFKDISIPLALRQRFNQGMQNAAFERIQRRGKTEIVQVAQDDDLRIRIQG